MVFGEVSLSYRELNRRANHLARHLRAAGVKPGSIVGLCVDRSPDLVIGILGILKAGGAYLPLDPTTPAERMTFMLEDARRAVLLRSGSLRADLAALPVDVAVSEELLPEPLRPAQKRNLPALTTPDNSGLRHLHLGLDRQAQGGR